ncbi:MAG: SIR2 family protein [Desulfobacterales bacterium]|nr:SIR2 family protein [Desulfobacterales bacterium]
MKTNTDLSEKEPIIPDSIRPFVNEIAKGLWAGRAAVMVGAGFSKNAGNDFPDWNQLGDLFYQEAHGVNPDPTSQKYLNVLRLADEVQAAGDHSSLEKLIRSKIPDMDTEPSDLHVELLELPWVDVFTTNYDTLLERASAKVVGRRYETVVNKEDIPYAIKPRIVKLHGSFPSERPFVVTEEDYRRYPYDYAPFVNTVQQSLLENTFCLIGFSGDDPNFLQWIGWIRDNLGRDNTQKIYLIGIFNFSDAKLQLLEQRGIGVVNLSCCDGFGNGDNKKALNRFFWYIRSKKPNVLDWPYAPQNMVPSHGADRIEEIQEITEEWQQQRQTYPGWLILPHDNRKTLWRYTEDWINYILHTLNTEKTPPGFDIQCAYELIWRFERCLHPIFDYVAEYCEKLLEKYWPFEDCTRKDYQFFFGKKECQDMPWDDLRQAWLAIALEMLRFYREQGNLEKWKKMETLLKGPARQLSVEQKEFLNYEGFLFCLFTLDPPGAKQRLENWQPDAAQPYWSAKRASALAEMGQFNGTDEQIRLSLFESRKKNNNDNTSSDFQSVSTESFQMLLFRCVKRAIDWMIDKQATTEEKQQIKEYLADKRSRGVTKSNGEVAKVNLVNELKTSKQMSESDLQVNSTIEPPKKFSSFKEDWDDLEKKQQKERKAEWDWYLSNIRETQLRNELQQHNARLDELKAFRCDPWKELELFALTLKNPPVQNISVTEKQKFDIGRATKNQHWGSTDEEAFNAYSFLRFCEEVGLPYCVGNTTIVGETALASLQRISRSSPFWAFATLARLGEEKAVDSLFNRKSVYKFTSEEADLRVKKYLEALNKCRDDIHVGHAFLKDNYGVRLTQVLLEVISRLCCKCSVETKRQILRFVTEIYSSRDKLNYGNVKNMTQRLVSSMSEVEQYKLLPDLLKISFPEGLNSHTEDGFPNPFLILELKQKTERAQALEIEPNLVASLLRQATEDKPDRRRWAVSSLVTLHELQLLDEVQSKKLAEALWHVTDQYHLPDDTIFYKFAFLKLPHPDSVDPVHLFKVYVKATLFPIQKNEQENNVGVTMTVRDIHIVREIIGANSKGGCIWTAEEAAEILQRILEWWNADKDMLSEKGNVPSPFQSIREAFRARFSRIVELLAEVVCPKLGSDSSDEIKTSLGRLLKEIQEYGLSCCAAEVECLHIFPDQRADVYKRIHEALISDQGIIQGDALNAIARILFDGKDTNASIVEPDPTSMLCQYITWCPTDFISFALQIVVLVLEHSRASFSTSLEDAVLKRLNRLLTDTAYKIENPNFETYDNSDSDFDKKLEVRLYSSELAAALWTYYRMQNKPIPEVVEKWRKSCLSPNEFSEIKNPWINRATE